MELNIPSVENADEWQIFLWNTPDDLLTRPQKLQLMLMLEARFNAFNPYRIVVDLLSHRDLWSGAVMERAYIFPEPKRPGWAILRGDLIHLRDVSNGQWNVDTLYILTTANSDTEWRRIAEDWKADEVDFYDGKLAESLLGVSGAGMKQKILRVWWD